MSKVLKEKKLLKLLRRKKSEKKLDPEVERILNKLAEETAGDGKKEKEILEALEKAFKNNGGEINACSRCAG